MPSHVAGKPDKKKKAAGLQIRRGWLGYVSYFRHTKEEEKEVEVEEEEEEARLYLFIFISFSRRPEGKHTDRA